jgi:hypothetical protein
MLPKQITKSMENSAYLSALSITTTYYQRYEFHYACLITASDLNLGIAHFKSQPGH